MRCRGWSNAGYEVHNVDLVPLDSPGVTNLIADITDSGQVFNALSMHRDFPDLDGGQGRAAVRCGRSFRCDAAHSDQA